MYSACVINGVDQCRDEMLDTNEEVNKQFAFKTGSPSPVL